MPAFLILIRKKDFLRSEDCTAVDVYFDDASMLPVYAVEDGFPVVVRVRPDVGDGFVEKVFPEDGRVDVLHAVREAY